MMILNSNSAKLIISDDFSSMTTSIYLISLEGLRQVVTGYDGTNLVKTEIGEGDAIKGSKVIPLLVVPYFMSRQLLALFQESAKENDIRPKDESVMEGKLIATKEHLVDMQKIVNKLLKIEA